MKQNEMTCLSRTRRPEVFQERTLYKNRRENWKSVIVTEMSKGMNHQHERRAVNWKANEEKIR